MPDWTTEQRAAIELPGKNLLVAAAAGSGKTAVLVARIIRQVLEGGVDVDKLLVMTFTDAAAREMRQRVESSLEKALEKTDAGDTKRIARIERQLVLLSGASISTMHTFCMKVLQRHFEAIDLDPQFRLGNDQELALLRQDVLEELFDEEYEKGTASFLQFVTDYGDDRGDKLLHEIVEQLYNFSLSQPFPDEWLKKMDAKFDLADHAAFEETDWYPLAEQDIRMTLRSLASNFAALEDDAESVGSEPYAAALHDDRIRMEALLETQETGDWEALRAAFLAMKFKTRKKDDDLDEVSSKTLNDRRDKLKKQFKACKEKYFTDTPEALLDGMRRAAPDVHELVRLTLAFHAAFAQAKKEKGLADFSDLEHFALAILVNHDARAEAGGALVPSAVARSLQDKYEEVMVDECQDTNSVQEAIVSLVTRKAPPNLFIVGDVKQSIYRFRLAEPHLFLEKQQDFPKTPETSECIFLSQNFRSRPEVLAAINYLFAQVMVPGTMELTYDRDAALHPGFTYPETDGPTLAGPQELAWIYKDDGEEDIPASSGEDEDEGTSGQERTAIMREAQYIADRIKSFFEEKTLVYHKDDGQYHPIEYRDIVILLRGLKGKGEQVLQVLQENDIPAYASSDAGYFEAHEVSLMLSLLSILDNARQDIPLAAVLLSPIGGFSLAEMAAVRLAAPEGDIFTALLTAADPDKKIDAAVQSKAAEFLKRLAGWRDIAREISVPELIWQLYRETGYYDYVGGLPGGLLKQANLRVLVSRAAAYEETNFRGLSRFLHFVARMKAMDTDLAAARTLGESENVVRIMTIHASKGLEFPLVFVASVGSSFNLKDSKKEFLVHRTLGFGPYAVDAPLAVRYATFARQVVQQAIVQESKAEELRLLYVALTRARERLILVGTGGKQDTFLTRVRRWGQYAARTELALPDDAPLAAENFLDWLLMALLHHPGAEDLREDAGLTQDIPAFLDDGHVLDGCQPTDWRITCLPASDVRPPQEQGTEENAILAAVRERKPLPESAQKAAVETLLDWQYPSHGLEAVPSKLSVSELKRRFAAQEAEEDGTQFLVAQEQKAPWKRPRFLQETTRLTGAEYGSLMHSVLQYVNLAGNLTPAGIRTQVGQMVERELLTADEARAVHADTVAAFYASDVGKRLQKASRVWREMPFSRLLPVDRFYPEAEAGETMLIQGVIDLLFEEPDGTLVLVDYKTDSDTRPESIKKRYALQVELYSEAVSAVLGKHVDERELYLLHDGTTLAM